MDVKYSGHNVNSSGLISQEPSTPRGPDVPRIPDVPGLARLARAPGTAPWALLLALVVGTACSPRSGPDETSPGPTAQEEWVKVFPTYAYQEGGEWHIPLTYRVHEERSWLGRVTARVAEQLTDPDPAEMDRFRERIHDFVTDSESRESVTFVVEEDPLDRPLRLEDAEGEPVRTGLNGVASGTLTLDPEMVREIRAAGGVDDWMTLTAVSPDHAGRGRVHLVEDQGLSIISDIDDTVKRTGIPSGARTVVRKTFFEEWEALPRMAERFQEWEAEAGGSLAIHWVSAGPTQLQRHLKEFLTAPEQGFPAGSFHMRHIRRHPLSLRTWRDLYNLVVDETGTFDYKVAETARIVERFPDRDFILVGDSGQDDPEAYRAVQERYPERIRKIVIRDVVDARTRNPERLEGMEVVAAEDLRSAPR